MNWQKLESQEQLNTLDQLSHQQRVLIFKHSTRCSISATALSRLERAWNDNEMQGIVPVYLDLIAHRSISNTLTQKYGVRHESPQVLLVENGKCIYHASHYDIRYEVLKNYALPLSQKA